MPGFIHNNWLLSTPLAVQLYHEYAAPQPIIDYHNHLSPAYIAANHKFANLHEAWLAGDHYKWRAMRAAGIDEALITGTASPRDKFAVFAKTVPLTARNPLYHWSHLELKRYFDVDQLLNQNSAEEIYNHSSRLLQSDGYGARDLLVRQNVKLVCTTDDPLDSLEHHVALAQEDSPVEMRPAFRPDRALMAQRPDWRVYLSTLGNLVGEEITSYESLMAALESRMDHFAASGCRLSDHGLSYIPAAGYNPTAADKLLRNKTAIIDQQTADTFLFTLLTDLGRSYARRGWTMQLHLGALRNNNSRAERELGPDTGYDSIGDFPQAVGLARLLDQLNSTAELPQTILYNLNPADNYVFATMAGNFCGGGTKAKVQWGAAWWFLDQWDGMKEQLNTLSNVGLLSQFVGMLTDSRSFLSFPRHEYFRRLLCDLLATDVQQQRLPHDERLLGSMVASLCYENTLNWFKW